MPQLLWKKLVNKIVFTRARLVNKELCYRTYKENKDHITKAPLKSFSQLKSYKFNNQISFHLMFKIKLLLIKIILKVFVTLKKNNLQIKLN